MSPSRGQHRVRLPDEVAAQWQRIDEDNTRWLGELVDARGWPGRTLAGQDGAAAAWLLAQHADRDPVRQREFLEALRGAAGRGEASPAHLAYLEDRVPVNAGQPQLMAPSSPSPMGNSGRIQLRIRNGWTSAARKPDLNHLLTTKPECEACHSERLHRPRQRSCNSCPIALTCRMASGYDSTPGTLGVCGVPGCCRYRAPFRSLSLVAWCRRGSAGMVLARVSRRGRRAVPRSAAPAGGAVSPS